MDNPELVEKIRALRSLGHGRVAIAKRFSVTQGAVADVMIRENMHSTKRRPRAVAADSYAARIGRCMHGAALEE
jgi:hypothetical protein